MFVASSIRRFLWSLFLLGTFFGTSSAHIGNPNVFLEGSAGPYQVRVSIRPPEVIPGRAQINVRVHNSAVTKVGALPVRWDAGRKGAPPPDIATLVPGETNLYTTELWLMDFGAYSVFVDIEGPLGTGTAIVPLNSVSSQRLPMPGSMAAIFLGAGMVLVILLVALVGAAVREGVLPINEMPSRKGTIRGRIFMGVATALILLVLWRGKQWWDEVDVDFRNNRLFTPIEMVSRLETQDGKSVLDLFFDPTTREWRDHTPIVPDHGKLMHLFLIREPALDAFAHLHPARISGTNYQAHLPSLPPGNYALYADITHESGLTQTLLSKAAFSKATDPFPAMDPDDSWSAAIPPVQSDEFPFDNGSKLRWVNHSATLPQKSETMLKFELLAADDKPAPLEPYMGMWSHAVIRSHDGSVFSHVHPMGTISMAAQELFAKRERERAGPKGFDVICGRVDRELSFPYAFPRPGAYRIWVQTKSNGQVLTGAFDLAVH